MHTNYFCKCLYFNVLIFDFSEILKNGTSQEDRDSCEHFPAFFILPSYYLVIFSSFFGFGGEVIFIEDCLIFRGDFLISFSGLIASCKRN